jgi:hypothetical protein
LLTGFISTNVTAIPKLLRVSTLSDWINLFRGGTIQRLSEITPAQAQDFPKHPEYLSYYQQYILPDIEYYDTKRIRALLKTRDRLFWGTVAVGILLGLFLGALAGGLSAHIPTEFFDDVLVVLGLCVVGVIMWVLTDIRAYEDDVRHQIFPTIFRYFNPDAIYRPTNNTFISSITRSDIIPTYHKMVTKGYVKTQYSGVDIECIGLLLTNSSDKNAYTKCKFRGQAILLSMNKTFFGKTIVKRDMGVAANWLSGKFSTLERAPLEDPRFESLFQVYTTNQVEARYLLTTSFMERLLALQALYEPSIEAGQIRTPTRTIECSFFDDNLLILIPTDHDIFSNSSVFKPSTFIQESNTILQEMDEIFGIIDILKLNESTGL